MPKTELVLQALKPKTKTNVMALLTGLGHDTEYWTHTKDGNPVDRPAANPSYCYDWSFGSAVEGIVLCVWHDSIESEGGCLVFKENMRSLDEDLSALAFNRSRNAKERDRARQQATRARDFDALVRLAFDRLLPIRFIINEGDRTDREQLGEGSSEVHKRAVDPEQWYVHAYEDKTGDFKIVRSLLPARDAVDAFDDPSEPGTFQKEDEKQLRAISIRRGQREFRDRLLSAWKRRCVVTECRVEALLEAAHITPHSVEPNYRTSNGLLLRADIHTLYDLGLLSIDEFMRVHLAPSLQYSEYKHLDGKRIERRPDQAIDSPAIEALRRRHEHFLKSAHGDSVSA